MNDLWIVMLKCFWYNDKFSFKFYGLVVVG
jgi:hypothetical protein